VYKKINARNLAKEKALKGKVKKEFYIMTINERAELAASLKNSGKCNCTQSVLEVFKDELKTDPESLRLLGAGFAAGMGCLSSTCGALIGAVMVAGELTNGKATPRVSKEIFADFNERSGATICKDLKGMGTGQVVCPCDDCVRNAVLALGKQLNMD